MATTATLSSTSSLASLAAIPGDQFTFVAGCRHNGIAEFEAQACGHRFNLIIGDARSAELLRAHYNGTPEEFDTWVMGRVGTITDNRSQGVPANIVDAFNQWRALDHAARVHRVCSNPLKYGPVQPDDPMLCRPEAVVSAHLDLACGWNRSEPQS